MVQAPSRARRNDKPYLCHYLALQENLRRYGFSSQTFLMHGWPVLLRCSHGHRLSYGGNARLRSCALSHHPDKIGPRWGERWIIRHVPLQRNIAIRCYDAGGLQPKQALVGIERVSSASVAGKDDLVQDIIAIRRDRDGLSGGD